MEVYVNGNGKSCWIPCPIHAQHTRFIRIILSVLFGNALKLMHMIKFKMYLDVYVASAVFVCMCVCVYYNVVDFDWKW